MIKLSKKKLWRYSLISTIAGIIVICYLWLSCRESCLTIFMGHYDSLIDGSVSYVKKGSIVVLLFFLFKIFQMVFINTILKKIMQKLGSSERYNSICKIANFTMWTFFIFVAISTMIGNISTIIASLGLLGFGLTFALQKPILNFVGWLTIVFKDIYHEGDRIKINNVIGDVKSIQIMNTIVEGLLETSDMLSGKTISFPNDLILSTDVQNFTKDSNYIVTELSISITYESDYHRAMKLLKEIISLQVQKNKQKYIKRLTKRNIKLNEFVNQWLDTSNTKKQEDEQKELMEIARIKHEKENLENDLKALDDEFVPLIRIEMLDSSLQLIAQFKSPYNEIRLNRTQINIAFLDAIKNEKNIEIAYPHMQLIRKDKM